MLRHNYRNRFFQIFKLGNIFENFTKKGKNRIFSKNWKKKTRSYRSFLTWFSSNFIVFNSKLFSLACHKKRQKQKQKGIFFAI